MNKKLAGLAAVILILGACGDDPPSPDERGLSGEITVVADSSLTEAFTELGSEFRDVHPRTRIEFEFADRSEVGEKAGDGGDVVALAQESADPIKGEVNRLTVVARTPLVIFVAPGNPRGIKGLPDLAAQGVRLALCEESAPCGVAASDALERAGVTPASPAVEPTGKAAAAQVTDGTADAAVVYVSDVHPGDTTVERIDLADEHLVVTSYAVGRLESTKDARLADAFIAFSVSGEGQEVLRSFGFGPP